MPIFVVVAGGEGACGDWVGTLGAFSTRELAQKAIDSDTSDLKDDWAIIEVQLDVVEVKQP